jgi:hypothetical protein
MISNTWEELSTNNFKHIGRFHERFLEEMGIPKWMNLNCPYCNAKLGLNSIREFGLKLNPRNMGDIFVQICCDKCEKMDTLYFKSEVNKLSDFAVFICDGQSPKNEPMLEDKMYKENYNNLLEKTYSRLNDLDKVYDKTYSKLTNKLINKDGQNGNI